MGVPETLLLTLYGAVRSPSRWPEFLAALADRMKADAAVIRWTSPERPRQALASHGAAPTDPVILRTRLGDDGAGPDLTLELFRASGRGPFEDPQLELLDALTPHLRRAVRTVSATLARGPDETSRQALDAFGVGVAICSPDGKVLFANRAAHALPLEDGVAVRDGRLAFADPDMARAFDQALRRAWEAPSDLTATGHEAPPLVIAVAPFRSGSALLDALGPGAVAVYLLGGRPRRADPDALDRLRRHFGLTSSEAAITGALLSGQSVGDIAKARGVSIETVRTQVKLILDKTQSDRQADLFRLQSFLLVRLGSVDP